jgi:hypothetical protein
VIFNLLGVGLVAAGFFIAYIVCWLLNVTSDNVAMVIAGSLLFIGDLGYRLTRRAAPEYDIAAREYRAQAWFHHHQGGHVLFIPVWAYGLLFMGGGILGLLTGQYEPYPL